MHVLALRFLSLSLGLMSPGGQDGEPPAVANQLVEGRFGQALDTRQGGVIFPADDRLEQRPITIEFWARLLDRQVGAVLISHETEASGSHWELEVLPESSDLRFRSPMSRPPSVIAESSLEDGGWHFITLHLGADRVRIAVDGELRAEVEMTDHATIPPQRSGLAVGTRIEDRRPNAALIDDLRIRAGADEVTDPPRTAQVRTDETILLWDFDESEADYLARWTPGGETNQRNLPYPHKYADYEFKEDPDWIDGRWQGTDKGPFVAHSTQLPGHQVGPKTFTIFLGPERSSVALFDTEHCALVAGLTDATFTIDPMRFGLLRKPTLEGTVDTVVPGPKAWRRPPINAGDAPTPVDLDQTRFQKHRLHGNRVVLESNILGGTVEEVYDELRGESLVAIGRSLRIDQLGSDALLTLAEFPSEPTLRHGAGVVIAVATTEATSIAVAVKADEGAPELELHRNDACLPIDAGSWWSGTITSWSGPHDQLDAFIHLVETEGATANFEALTQPGPARWGEPIVTAGILGQDDGRAPYVIDTIAIPHENPFGALFFNTAFDFFANGDAAIATAHGDVWLVRNLDRDLDQVSWTRFATGLYQPLGLKVVDDTIIVLGRDRLTRLVDEDGDGEADVYESLNDDLIIQGVDHAYAMRLETDAEGNFYFLKSGAGPHGSALLKVSADGGELSVVAQGFRHPYGLGIGPNDEITVADNEGNWVPTSKIDLIRPGGFYGYLGSAAEAPEGVRPDPPLCYLPKVADNSSGGQVWYVGDRWGDYHRGGMLHLSWGRCTLHAVLRDRVGEIDQASTVRFPGLAFLSGSGEAEFHPIDGQLYVIGLNGWQTGAVADGSFQRVRHTGRPIHMPESLQAFEDGILLRFSGPIDTDLATDLGRYRAERWNYQWSSTYGSFHYSVEDPALIGHDPLTILSAEPLPDGKGVFLRTDAMVPVDQLWLATDLTTEDGNPLRFDIYATVHALHPSSDRTP